MKTKQLLSILFPLLILYFLFQIDGGKFHNISKIDAANEQVLHHYSMDQAASQVSDEEHHHKLYIFAQDQKKVMIAYERSLFLPGYALASPPQFFENKPLEASSHSQFYQFTIREKPEGGYTIHSEKRPEGFLNIAILLGLILVFIRLLRTHFNFEFSEKEVNKNGKRKSSSAAKKKKK